MSTDTNAAATFFTRASVADHAELSALRIVRVTSTPTGEQTSELSGDATGIWSPRASFGSAAGDEALVPATREHAQAMLDLLANDRLIPPWSSLDTPAGVSSGPEAKPLGTTRRDPVGMRTRVIGVGAVVILVVLLHLALSHGWL